MAPLTSSDAISLVHFEDIFEVFSSHTIRTKKKMQINGAVLSANIFIPDSFYINGYTLRSLKGKILKVSVYDREIIKIEGAILD
jgi:hypothetical protein